MEKYDPKVTPWQIDEQDYPKKGSQSEKLEFLLKYAVLAPSSHNTQPWKFLVKQDEIQIFADTSRWLKVADSDKKELYISAGCALENLLIAAEHFGYAYEVTYLPDPKNNELAATVKFKPGKLPPFSKGAVFAAIPDRHTNHKVYQDRPIPPGDLKRLQDCCVEEDIFLHLTDNMEIKRKADELIIRADRIQFSDQAWREELAYWIGQGVFGTSWMITKLGQLAVPVLDLGKSTGRKDSELLMNSPVLGMLSSKNNDRVSQIKAGRVFERICLTASILRVSIHPMSQILQIPEIKTEAAKLIPVQKVFPQQPFRLGYAEPEKEHAPRRPLEEFLVQ